MKRLVRLLLLIGGLLCLPPPAAALEHRGAQVHPWFSGRSAADNVRELDALAAAGADTARMDLPWSSVEPRGPGLHDTAFLARVDAYVEAAAARGIRPVLNLHSTPCWASSAPGKLRRSCRGGFGDASFHAPSSPGDLERVSAFLAARYASRLTAFEVWNEPDHPFFMRGAAGKAGRADLYAPMLRAAHRGVKRAAPGLDVLGGAIEGTDSEFLQLLYDRDISGHYDAISYQPYNGRRAPTEPRPQGWSEDYELSHGTVRMRNTMLRNGDRRPRLWMTEYGWSTCAYDEPGEVPSRCVDGGTQAAYIARAAALTRTWFPFVEGMSVYEVRDSRESEPPGCYECRFGLLRADFSAKPAYAAFRGANGPLGSPLLPPD